MSVYVSVCLNHRFTTGTDTGAVKERPRWRAFQHKTQGHKDDEVHNNEINSNRLERKYQLHNFKPNGKKQDRRRNKCWNEIYEIYCWLRCRWGFIEESKKKKNVQSIDKEHMAHNKKIVRLKGLPFNLSLHTGQKTMRRHDRKFSQCYLKTGLVFGSAVQWTFMKHKQLCMTIIKLCLRVS